MQVRVVVLLNQYEFTEPEDRYGRWSSKKKPEVRSQPTTRLGSPPIARTQLLKDRSSESGRTLRIKLAGFVYRGRVAITPF